MYNKHITLDMCNNFEMEIPNISIHNGNNITSVRYDHVRDGRLIMTYNYRPTQEFNVRRVRISTVLGTPADRSSVTFVRMIENENTGNYVGESRYMMWDNMDPEIDMLIEDYNIRTKVNNVTNNNNN